jgi:tetratricopeptide (TPR) repeat protein
VLLLAAVVGLQAARDRHLPAPRPAGADNSVLYIQSGEFMKRAALSYDALAADVYWMRALQYFGRTKLSTDPHKTYEFLYPLLDLTTTLDPDFEIAYRFGAVFLAEEFPGGAGRPDLAIALLEKGLASHPKKWQYAQDIGFVHYWWRHDYSQAADWFKRAARLPLAPNWLAPMAAVTLTQGGNRESARRLWTQVFNNTEADWLMEQARFRLTQLDAMDQIDALERMVKTYQARTGSLPRAWSELVRAGLLAGVPVDPRNFPYELNPYWGTVGLSPDSTLAPLPTEAQVTP